MTYTAALAAAILAAASSPLLAQGFTGGELGIEYNVPTDASDLGGTTYSGGIEYGFMQTFTVSANAAGYDSDLFDSTGSNVTLHATYNLSSAASVGAFYGRDDIDGDHANLYGIEGGTEFMGGDVGGYIGRADDDATIVGIDGSYDLNNSFSLIGNADLLDVDGATVSQISVGAEYQLAVGPQFYGQIGVIRSDVDDFGSDSQGYITIGAKVAIGSQRGTTFTNRSTFEVFPGF